MTTENILLSIAIQFPLLVLFVIYNERKDKSFQAFLTDQRKEYLDVLRSIANKLDNHDDATRQAIARMEERTRPRPDRLP